jgi:hypothetical protein
MLLKASLRCKVVHTVIAFAVNVVIPAGGFEKSRYEVSVMVLRSHGRMQFVFADTQRGCAVWCGASL